MQNHIYTNKMEREERRLNQVDLLAVLNQCFEDNVARECFNSCMAISGGKFRSFLMPTRNNLKRPAPDLEEEEEEEDDDEEDDDDKKKIKYMEEEEKQAIEALAMMQTASQVTQEIMKQQKKEDKVTKETMKQKKEDEDKETIALPSDDEEEEEEKTSVDAMELVPLEEKERAKAWKQKDSFPIGYLFDNAEMKDKENYEPLLQALKTSGVEPMVVCDYNPPDNGALIHISTVLSEKSVLLYSNNHDWQGFKNNMAVVEKKKEYKEGGKIAIKPIVSNANNVWTENVTNVFVRNRLDDPSQLKSVFPSAVQWICARKMKDMDENKWKVESLDSTYFVYTQQQQQQQQDAVEEMKRENEARVKLVKQQEMEEKREQDKKREEEDAARRRQLEKEKESERRKKEAEAKEAERLEKIRLEEERKKQQEEEEQMEIEKQNALIELEQKTREVEATVAIIMMQSPPATPLTKGEMNILTPMTPTIITTDDFLDAIGDDFSFELPEEEDMMEEWGGDDEFLLRRSPSPPPQQQQQQQQQEKRGGGGYGLFMNRIPGYEDDDDDDENILQDTLEKIKISSRQQPSNDYITNLKAAQKISSIDEEFNYDTTIQSYEQLVKTLKQCRSRSSEEGEFKKACESAIAELESITAISTSPTRLFVDALIRMSAAAVIELNFEANQPKLGKKKFQINKTRSGRQRVFIDKLAEEDRKSKTNSDGFLEFHSFREFLFDYDTNASMDRLNSEESGIIYKPCFRDVRLMSLLLTCVLPNWYNIGLMNLIDMGYFGRQGLDGKPNSNSVFIEQMFKKEESSFSSGGGTQKEWEKFVLNEGNPLDIRLSHAFKFFAPRQQQQQRGTKTSTSTTPAKVDDVEELSGVMEDINSILNSDAFFLEKDYLILAKKDEIIKNEKVFNTVKSAIDSLWGAIEDREQRTQLRKLWMAQKTPNTMVILKNIDDLLDGGGNVGGVVGQIKGEIVKRIKAELDPLFISAKTKDDVVKLEAMVRDKIPESSNSLLNHYLIKLVELRNKLNPPPPPQPPPPRAPPPPQPHLRRLRELRNEIINGDPLSKWYGVEKFDVDTFFNPGGDSAYDELMELLKETQLAFKRLSTPTNWLNDENVNLMAQLMIPSFFETDKWGKSNMAYIDSLNLVSNSFTELVKKVKEREKNWREQIKFLFIGHNLDGNHWMFYVIDMNRKCVYVVDSIGIEDQSVIQSCLKILFGKDAGKFKIKQYELWKQADNVNCGVFSIYGMLLLARRIKTLTKRGEETNVVFDKYTKSEELDKLLDINKEGALFLARKNIAIAYFLFVFKIKDDDEDDGDEVEIVEKKEEKKVVITIDDDDEEEEEDELEVEFQDKVKLLPKFGFSSGDEIEYYIVDKVGYAPPREEWKRATLIYIEVEDGLLNIRVKDENDDKVVWEDIYKKYKNYRIIRMNKNGEEEIYAFNKIQWIYN